MRCIVSDAIHIPFGHKYALLVIFTRLVGPVAPFMAHALAKEKNRLIICSSEEVPEDQNNSCLGAPLAYNTIAGVTIIPQSIIQRIYAACLDRPRRLGDNRGENTWQQSGVTWYWVNLPDPTGHSGNLFLHGYAWVPHSLRGDEGNRKYMAADCTSSRRR